MRAIAVLTGLLLVEAARTAAASPRVMLVNMCTDQLVVSLAAPEQIASLTRTAFCPSVSVMAERAVATGVAVNRRTAEEAMLQKPDLVFIGAWSEKNRRTLAQFGQSVVFFPVVKSVDEAIGQVLRAGKLLEREEMAKRVAASIVAARDRARCAAAAGVVVSSRRLQFRWKDPGFGSVAGRLDPQHDGGRRAERVASAPLP